MIFFCNALNSSAVQVALSPARLKSYQDLVGATSLEAAVGAYVWGLELNAALTPLLSTVEVVLRNSIHEAASAHFGKPDWYQDVIRFNGDHLWSALVATQPQWATTHYRKGVPPYNKKTIWVAGTSKKLKHWRSQSEMRVEEIANRLSKEGRPNSPDQIVAHAMFGFWLTLLGPSFESAAPLSLWPQCTAGVFPCDPNMTRARAHTLLERVKIIRNRVSHQEPAWRIAAPLTPAGVHAAVSVRIQEIQELLEAMAPDVVRMIENIGTFDRLRWLLDPQTISSFSGQTAVNSIDMKKLTRKVRTIAKSALKARTAAVPQPNKLIKVHHAGQTLITLVPHH